MPDLEPQSEPKPTDSEGQPRPTQGKSSISALAGVILRIALPLAFLAVGYHFYTTLSVEVEEEKEDEETAGQVIRTNVVELEIQDYPIVIRTNGFVQPHNLVTLSAQVSGQVTFVSPSFEVGTYFDAGDVLIEIDDRDFVTAVAVAEAQKKSAASALSLAEQNHDRNLRLYENKVVSISAAEVNQSEAERAQAEAQRDSAVAALEQAKRDLERTKVRAPFDGRVMGKQVGLGQSVGAGTALGVAFAVDFAEVRLPIAARELRYLELPELPGDPPVDVVLHDSIDDANDTTWSGKIVRTEGSLDADSLELFAIARVDDPFGRKSPHAPLRIGQPVVATIVGTTLTDVIALPRSAVRQLDQIVLVDKQELTLSTLTIDEIWSDEDNIFARDPRIQAGSLLATTQLVYAPDGAKVEIIPDIELTASTNKPNQTEAQKQAAN